MVEHCLYGVKVHADIDLFERPVPLSAVAPGEHAPLELCQGNGESPTRGDYAHTTRLFSSHGRALYLHSDRPLAPGASGQIWCMEVVGVVRFTWRGCESVVYYELDGEATRDLLAFWFVHIFLPLYLTLERGYDFIHSAAVEIDACPVLFLAPSTGGKRADRLVKEDRKKCERGLPSRGARGGRQGGRTL